MRRAVITGWRAGLKKVSLTKLLHDACGYSLSQAKGITDSVLDNQSVTLELPDDQFAQIVVSLKEIGVKCSEG